MSQTENFFRKYSDLVLEAEGKLSEPIRPKTSDDDKQPTGPNAPTPKPEDKVEEGPVTSNVAVRPGDKDRVQVAPNIQKSVVDYERKKAEAERARDQQAQEKHPIWTKAGELGGDVVGGAQSRWNALKSSFGQAQDRQTGRDVNPDPAKPVDVIPNPRHGTATPRSPQRAESAQQLMREYSNIITEAEFKNITNKMESAKDVMKPYKPQKD